MSNYVRNFDVKNYQNQTTIPQLIANNMSGCFFLKHGVVAIVPAKLYDFVKLKTVRLRSTNHLRHVVND